MDLYCLTAEVITGLSASAVALRQLFQGDARKRLRGFLTQNPRVDFNKNSKATSPDVLSQVLNLGWNETLLSWRETQLCSAWMSNL